MIIITLVHFLAGEEINHPTPFVKRATRECVPVATGISDGEMKNFPYLTTANGLLMISPPL